jgi:hypothetical protein
MMIGKAGAARTAICHRRRRFDHRAGSRPLRDLIGRRTFTEFFFLR